MLYCNLRHVFLFYWGIVDLLVHVLSQHSYPRSLPCFSLSTSSTAWHPSSFLNRSVFGLSVIFISLPFHSLFFYLFLSLLILWEPVCLISVSLLTNLGHSITSLVQESITSLVQKAWAALVAQRLKRLPAMWETQVWSLGPEDPLEKEMATHSSILAWEIPSTEEPGGLQSMGSQRVGHNWATSLSLSRGK